MRAVNETPEQRLSRAITEARQQLSRAGAGSVDYIPEVDGRRSDALPPKPPPPPQWIPRNAAEEAKAAGRVLSKPLEHALSFYAASHAARHPPPPPPDPLTEEEAADSVVDYIRKAQPQGSKDTYGVYKRDFVAFLDRNKIDIRSEKIDLWVAEYIRQRTEGVDFG